MSYPRILLNVSHILIDGLFDSVPLLLSFIALSFAASEKEVGFAVSLAILFTTLCGLSSKFFSRHFSLFRAISLIVLLDGIGFFLAAFSASIQLAGFCFIIAIAGYCAFHNIAFSHLSATTPRRTLGQTIGNFTALGDLGRIPLASLAAFIAAIPVFGFAGWRFICLVYGMVALLFAVFLFLLGANQEKPPVLLATDREQHLPAFSLLRNRQHALPISASICDAFASDHLFTFLPYLLFAKGIAPTVIGTFAMAFTCGCLLGKIACGRLVDRFGTRKVFVLSELLMLLLLTLLLVSTQLFIIIGASLLLGIVTKGTVPVIQSILGESIREKQHYDDIFPLNTFFRGSTNMLTPLLFGCIAASFGINWIYALMGLAAFCAALPILFLPSSHPDEIESLQRKNSPPAL